MNIILPPQSIKINQPGSKKAKKSKITWKPNAPERREGLVIHVKVKFKISSTCTFITMK